MGESTTDDYFSDSVLGAWPRQLEKSLKKSGLDVQIINIAKGGDTTTMMLSEIDNILDYYKPQLVISMIGVNDYGHTKYIESSGVLEYILNNSALLKLKRWISHAIQNHNVSEVSMTTPAGYYDYLHNLIGLNQDHQLSISAITNLRTSNCQKSIIIAEYNTLTNLEETDINLHASFLVKALKLCPAHPEVAMRAMALHVNDESLPNSCDDIYKILKPYLSRLETNTISQLLACYTVRTAPKYLKDFLQTKRVEYTTDEYDVDLTKKNYNILYNKLFERDITLIAMQYPTVGIEELKSYFQNSKVYFIENKANFMPYLPQDYDKVFIDKFQQTWGHTTLFGHKLISDNLEKIVRGIILSSKQ